MKPLSLCLLLSLLPGLLPRVCFASEPLRLDDIAVVRFVQTAPNQWIAKRGLSGPLRGFRETSSEPVLSSVTIPSDALLKNLISTEAWLAYGRLGPEALVNFSANLDGGSNYILGSRTYHEVVVSDSPRFSHGKLTAISTRGLVTDDSPLIAGFIVEEQHRRVLVRAVGSSLAVHGVPNALADPFLTIFKGNTGLHYNGDWSQRPDAAEIAQVTAALGLAPLTPNSRESALLVELPSGIYTASVEIESGESGVALVEVYSVPE